MGKRKKKLCYSVVLVELNDVRRRNEEGLNQPTTADRGRPPTTPDSGDCGPALTLVSLEERVQLSASAFEGPPQYHSICVGIKIRRTSDIQKRLIQTVTDSSLIDTDDSPDTY